VQALLEHGADVNARARGGGTALTLAATGGDARIVRALLDRGAEVESESARPDTNALKLAVKYGHDEIVRLLKKAGGGATGEGEERAANKTRRAGKKKGAQ
jgi:ankyrin repeat protein